jgi:hypothetical protein
MNVAVRKKQIKGASALKEIEAKRAAKKARLELAADTKVSDIKTEKIEEKSDQEDMKTDGKYNNFKYYRLYK